MNEDEITLIKNAKFGNKKALKELIKKEQTNIYATLFYLKKDECEINDIMQDVLIKLVKNISKLKHIENFKTWLNQIIINSYYDYLRKNKKNKIIQSIEEENKINDFSINSYKTNPINTILFNELDLVIKNSIENLPIHYKIPITLREIQGLSYDEISNITNTSIGTVKSRIARARALIKSDVNKYTKG